MISNSTVYRFQWLRHGCILVGWGMQNGSTLSTSISWFRSKMSLSDHFFHGQTCMESFVSIKRDAVKKWLNLNGFTSPSDKGLYHSGTFQISDGSLALPCPTDPFHCGHSSRPPDGLSNLSRDVISSATCHLSTWHHTTTSPLLCTSSTQTNAHYRVGFGTSVIVVQKGA